MATEFISLWLSGANDEDAHEQLTQLLEREGPLYGRVIHGTREEDFVRLSTDSWKRLSWIFGPDALHHFLGRNLYEVCLFLGFGEMWLKQKLSSGTMFKLCVFSGQSLDICEQATWNGLFTLLEHEYPEVWPLLRQHQQDMITIPFEEIENVAGYSMKAVNVIGRDPNTGECSDPRYVSLSKLVSFTENSNEKDQRSPLVVTRQFLFDEIGVKELFSGNGMTWSNDPMNHPPCCEYLTKTVFLNEIEGCVVVDLDISSR